MIVRRRYIMLLKKVIWKFNIVRSIQWTKGMNSLSGDEKIANLLIKSGTNVNMQDLHGKTALHLATQRGNQ